MFSCSAMYVCTFVDISCEFFNIAKNETSSGLVGLLG